MIQFFWQVYDGVDWTGELTVYTGDNRAFYQSSGPHLYIVLKIYDIKETDKPPQFDALVTFTEG